MGIELDTAGAAISYRGHKNFGLERDATLPGCTHLVKLTKNLEGIGERRCN